MSVKFCLKHFDSNLFSFSLESEGIELKCSIFDDTIKTENLRFLPKEFSDEISVEKLIKWLKHRIIPANRHYVKNFLAKCGLNENDLCGILQISYGLSLNDCYWLCPETETRSFEDLNLYDNKFSVALSAIAFTGYGSYQKSSFRSSPEFTTNGMLAKAWRRIDGKIQLYKSGSFGAANTGNEPYSEFYAFQVAEAMGINAVKYNLRKWKGKLCSTCEIFTSKDFSYIPTGNLLKFNKIDSVLDFYKNLGSEFYDSLVDMFVFDAVILNQDRHLGNFGLLIDNNTNNIIAPAPIFDNGLSLFCYAMDDDIKQYKKYSSTIRPALYSDFDGLVSKIITHRQRKMLSKLVNFKFKKHPRYNLPKERLDFLSNWVNEKAGILLKKNITQEC